MQVRTLWLTDYRSYTSVAVDLAPGLTALVGANGEGKTNLLEALAWLATLSSFRGAPTEALVRRGAPFAVVRALAEREGRELLIEAQLPPTGRNRVQVNRQPLRRARTCSARCGCRCSRPTTSPSSRTGPDERRRLLDDAAGGLHPRNDALRAEVDRVLRQRNALLRQAGGRLDEGAAFTLDVWDAKLASSGAALAAARHGPARPHAAGAVVHLRRPGPPAGAWWRPLRGRVGRGGPAATEGGAGAGADRGAGGGGARRRARGACPPWGRTATRWRCRSAAPRPGPRPARGSSGRWRWRCGWPPTTW